MATDRTAILRGPGAILFGSLVLHDADGISADLNLESSPVSSSLLGQVDAWRASRYATVSFRPAGAINATILAALYPQQTPDIGASLIGASDVALIVHSKAGTKLTFGAAGLVAPPQLRLSATQTAFGGAATFLAVTKKAVDPATDDAILKIESAAFSSATYPFATTDLKTGAYAGTYDSTTIATRAGWTVDVTFGTEDVVTDNEGLVDRTLASVAVVAKCQPTNLTEAQILAWTGVHGSGLTNGSSVRSGKDLVITAVGGVRCEIYDAALRVGPYRWGNVTLRSGEIAFVGERKLTAGVPGALYSIAMQAAS